jgi:hypothetical protein
MSPFEATVRRLKRDMDRIGVGWAFVGGLAVSVRANPRFTNDVDIAVAVTSDREAEAIVFRLKQLGYDLGVNLERDDGRLATSRLRCPPVRGTEFIVDLLFATTGIEALIVSNAEVTTVFPGFRAPIALASDLIAMKLLSVSEDRPKDDMDLRELVGRADDAVIARARESAALIESAGQPRGRSLTGLLDDYLRALQS